MMTFSRRSVLAMPLVLAACNQKSQLLEIAGFTMGTTYNIVAVDHDGRLSEEELRRAVDGALATVNRHLSNWDGGSEIAVFNGIEARESVTMSDDLSQVMQAAAAVHEASGGQFDTSIGPLIELWGFGAPGTRDLPSVDAVAQAVERSGQGRTLSIDGGTLTKLRPDAQVYLAGIGKGHGADRVGRALEELGLTDFLVEIGGDLYAAGRNANGTPWQVGIEAPTPGAASLAGVVGLTGMGMATSGDYRNYFEIEGERFSHLIDPQTGHPVTHTTASATVLAENAMMADAWSTAMLILGRARGLEVATANGIAVQFIERDRDADRLAFVTTNSAAFDDITA